MTVTLGVVVIVVAIELELGRTSTAIVTGVKSEEG